MEQIQLLQSFLMLQTTLNCLQRSNYLNKDSFSFAGVTEKSPQTKRTFGSDLFLQIISGSIYLLIEHWDGSCKVENSEMQWVNQGNKQRPSLLSTAADYPACCYACSPCSFSFNFFFFFPWHFADRGNCCQATLDFRQLGWLMQQEHRWRGDTLLLHQVGWVCLPALET